MGLTRRDVLPLAKTGLSTLGERGVCSARIALRQIKVPTNATHASHHMISESNTSPLAPTNSMHTQSVTRIRRSIIPTSVW